MIFLYNKYSYKGLRRSIKIYFIYKNQFDGFFTEELINKTKEITIIKTWRVNQYMNMKKILVVLFFLKICLSFLLKYLSYQGNESMELREDLLLYFTEADIQNGIEYSRSGFFGSVVSSIIQFIFIGVLVFSSITTKIEDYFNRKTSGRFFLTAFLFLATFYIAEFLISLPFAYYFGFILEHKFGFSNMTNGDWIILQLKSFSVGFVMVILLGIFALFILKKFQKLWKIILPIGFAIVGLLFSLLMPIIITPIFYEYTEIQDGSLKNKILKLTAKSNIPISKIYVINESKYSGHTNAYFVGWGDNRKIFLYDTLINKNTEDEVISILGHEIGHWIHNHQIKGILLGTIQLFILCFIISYLFEKTKNEGSLHLKEIYSPSSLPFIFFIFSIFNLLTAPLESYISQSFETEADIQSLKLTKDKKSFISSEIKIARHNKSRLNPHPIIVKMYYSHPPTIERIKLGEKYKE